MSAIRYCGQIRLRISYQGVTGQGYLYYVTARVIESDTYPLWSGILYLPKPMFPYVKDRNSPVTFDQLAKIALHEATDEGWEGMREARLSKGLLFLVKRESQWVGHLGGAL